MNDIISSECLSLDIRTKDYQRFIDSLCKLEKVFLSSLRGIILAESYGIPAIFLCKDREVEMLKYYDWYYSTGRKNVKMANIKEDILSMEPIDLPDLSLMRENLIESFPYDLLAK